MNHTDLKCFTLSDSEDCHTDNRDVFTTEVRYDRYPGIVFEVDIRFCLELIENALENAE